MVGTVFIPDKFLLGRVRSEDSASISVRISVTQAVSGEICCPFIDQVSSIVTGLNSP